MFETSGRNELDQDRWNQADKAPKPKAYWKKVINRIPILGGMARWIYGAVRSTTETKPEPFPGSAEYWEKRYSTGGDSGVGSYGFFAEFKADVLNHFVFTHDIQTVIEFGCGDGNQLSLARYPKYLGFDVSSNVLEKCRQRFKSDPHKSFRLISEFGGETADLALSLDVIYHLVEDDVFVQYMNTLFQAANRYVIIYASDTADNRGYEGTHVKHRTFTRWIQQNAPTWKLRKHLPNRYPYQGDYHKGSFADFFIYERTDS